MECLNLLGVLFLLDVVHLEDNNMRFVPILLIIFTTPALAYDGWKYSPAIAMNEDTRDYYVQTFNYAMETAKPNESYRWKANAAGGVIIASEKYVSKSNSICRNYTERYTIGEKNGNISGISCKRNGKIGWCRLKEGDALTCAMEEPPSLSDEILRDAGETPSNIKRWLGF